LVAHIRASRPGPYYARQSQCRLLTLLRKHLVFRKNALAKTAKLA
jgi:hypothetical protein